MAPPTSRTTRAQRGMLTSMARAGEMHARMLLDHDEALARLSEGGPGGGLTVQSSVVTITTEALAGQNTANANFALNPRIPDGALLLGARISGDGLVFPDVEVETVPTPVSATLTFVSDAEGMVGAGMGVSSPGTFHQSLFWVVETDDVLSVQLGVDNGTVATGTGGLTVELFYLA